MARAQTEESKALITIAAEANARRSVAKTANIKSGSLPVLALLVFRHAQGQNTRPSAVHATQIANKTLVRAYLRDLIAAKLVDLTVRRGRRWLSPTLDGLGLAAKYYRAVRSGRHEIETHL